MTREVLYRLLRQYYRETIDKYGVHDKTISVGYEEQESEIVLTAEYEGAVGECSTSFPVEFNGKLSEILEFDIENDLEKRSVFIASLNALMNKCKLSDDCVSCLKDDRENCAERIVGFYKKNNGKVKILLNGYQPHIMKALVDNFQVRVLDLNPNHIGKIYNNVVVEDGTSAFADASWWADIALCSGSALSDGTIVDYMNMPKDIIYYGTTIAGCARILQLRRLCPYARN